MTFLQLLLAVCFHRSLAVLTVSEDDNNIVGQYVVQLVEGTLLSNEQKEIFEEAVRNVSMEVSEYAIVHSGEFALILGSDEDLTGLKQLPQVIEAEPNVRVFSSDEKCFVQNVPDIWGLDRIDQRMSSGYNKTYVHGYESDGSRVSVYVLDTGVDVSNPEFDGRAEWGYTAPEMGSDTDANGHGTHVAGTIGADMYGVAKRVLIFAVKVLNDDGQGTSFSLLKGLEWVVRDYIENDKSKGVINLSLGLDVIHSATDVAIQEAIDAGITVVAAAGNKNKDACQMTPAHLPDVITVGATTVYDTVADFSNWGVCLDIWAPGADIKSITPSGTSVENGTSMASAHVAGIVARYMSYLDQHVSPFNVQKWLTDVSTKDAIEYANADQRTSPNRLVYMDCNDPDSASSISLSMPALFLLLLLHLLNAN
ncbi:MAG: S8 family peptidase [Gammaproteobacteria bacterium]|nr:S8 family peptidase [Gammaproteobacteria bacterium]